MPIVREGVLRGFLSSRETATEIGLARSGGCMRADGFARQPLVRMTNVNLEPGDAGTLEELIADTEQRRAAGHQPVVVDRLAPVAVPVRRRGGVGDPRRPAGAAAAQPLLRGVTPQFWGSMDAVCSASEWRLASVVNCGKGEPGQVARVSHGSAPARFRGVEMGVA